MDMRVQGMLDSLGSLRRSMSIDEAIVISQEREHHFWRVVHPKDFLKAFGISKGVNGGYKDIPLSEEGLRNVLEYVLIFGRPISFDRFRYLPRVRPYLPTDQRILEEVDSGSSQSFTESSTKPRMVLRELSGPKMREAREVLGEINLKRVTLSFSSAVMAAVVTQRFYGEWPIQPRLTRTKLRDGSFLGFGPGGNGRLKFISGKEGEYPPAIGLNKRR